MLHKGVQRCLGARAITGCDLWSALAYARLLVVGSTTQSTTQRWTEGASWHGAPMAFSRTRQPISDTYRPTLDSRVALFGAVRSSEQPTAALCLLATVCGAPRARSTRSIHQHSALRQLRHHGVTGEAEAYRQSLLGYFPPMLVLSPAGKVTCLGRPPRLEGSWRVPHAPGLHGCEPTTAPQQSL